MRVDLRFGPPRQHHPERTMFPDCVAETLSQAMGAAESDQARGVSRRAAHLVVGVDDTIASTVFGTITAMATVAVYGRAFPDSPWTVEELLVSTAVVLWLAHLYTHALSESISETKPLRFARLRTLARRELGILLAAVPPSIALLLGALGLFDETVSIWLALALGLGILALEGARYARIEHLRATGTLVAIAANVGLGVLVVVLKVEILH
jgi:hypothetical protein